jgi:hypothetical protein
VGLARRAGGPRRYDWLTEDGAEAWPLAYCEEDLAYEREQRLGSIDHAQDDIREREKKLGEELQRLKTSKQAFCAELDGMFPGRQPPRINQINHLWVVSKHGPKLPGLQPVRA